jgi:hypothetical protein
MRHTRQELNSEGVLAEGVLALAYHHQDCFFDFLVAPSANWVSVLRLSSR